MRSIADHGDAGIGRAKAVPGKIARRLRAGVLPATLDRNWRVTHPRTAGTDERPTHGAQAKEPTLAKQASQAVLDIGSLKLGYPALVPESGVRLAFAAAICLEECRHKPGANLSVTGITETTFRLRWPRTTDRVRREWSDLQEVTEHGAVGVAILLVDRLADCHIVQRAVKGTGVDYWLGPKGSRAFQGTARLEVSGILSGATDVVERRVARKLVQTEKSDNTRLPAFVVVVEFGSPLAVMVMR